MAHLSGRRILVVDDDPLAALMLERMLKELACKVPGRANTAADAMAIIEIDRAGLDAATVRLDDPGSADVAAALDGRDIPFVAITGPGSSSAFGPFRDCPLLVRPFQLEDLRLALGALDMKHRHSTR